MTAIEKGVEESGEAEIGKASEAKVSVELTTNDPRPVGGVRAEM